MPFKLDVKKVEADTRAFNSIPWNYELEIGEANALRQLAEAINGFLEYQDKPPAIPEGMQTCSTCLYRGKAGHCRRPLESGPHISWSKHNKCRQWTQLRHEGE
jgi:hypothetical protein